MELSPEERDHIFQEERARREAQQMLKREEKARTRNYSILGGLGLFLVLWIVVALVPKASKDGTITGPYARPESGSLDSGIRWSILPRTYRPGSIGRETLVVVLNRRPSDEELIAVAEKLFDRFYRFEFFDDARYVNEYVGWYETHPLGRSDEYPFPEAWLNRHHVGQLGFGPGEGSQWELTGAEARGFDHVLMYFGALSIRL